jgi:hypothetical protein
MATGDYTITIGCDTATSTTISSYGGGYVTYPDSSGSIDWGKTFHYPDYNQVNDFRLPNNNDEDIRELKKELKKLKKKLQNKEIPMKNLYNVVVVSIDEEIVLDEKVVANDENEATFNAGVHQALVEKNLKPKDVTITCTVISSSIRVRKEPQKVIMEKE